MYDNNTIPSGEQPAVPAPPDLHAEYKTDIGTIGTRRIYAFSIEGHPLVLAPDGDRLVRPEAAETRTTYVGVHTPYGPPLAGPFTPAPPGLVAVFNDGHTELVLYYDFHGRAVLMDENDVTCDLVLVESIKDVVRVEYQRSAADD